MLAVRSLLFYAGVVLVTALWGTFAAVVGFCLPEAWRFGFVIRTWVRCILSWLRLTCGIKVQVEGLHHLRDASAGILFVKHQSTWDALFSQMLVTPQTTVIKRSLLWIPCFGWAFYVTNPISIDRGKKVSAIRQLVSQGSKRLESGVWVTLFPEGTRVQVGEVGRFQIGGAQLAASTGVNVYAIAHNGGDHWKSSTFVKQPGTILVHISAPFDTADKSPKQINEETEQWMRTAMESIYSPSANG